MSSQEAKTEDSENVSEMKKEPQPSDENDGGDDDNEIGLDEDEEDAEQDAPTEETTNERATMDQAQEMSTQQPDAEEQPSTSKPNSMKERLRLLKQKMNQARQLNRQAVQEEGQKGHSAFNNRDSTKKKTAKADPLTQQAASQALYDARQSMEKETLNQYSVNDYHNPEGQFRNYQRNLRSVSSSQSGQQNDAASSTAVFDPTAQHHSTLDASAAERDGAHRLAQEMHRRIEKKQKKDLKRKQKEMAAESEGDVSYINQRNKRFNQKINRTYDEATAEIRQNLERGTAL